MNKYENVMVNVMIKMHFSLPIRRTAPTFFNSSLWGRDAIWAWRPLRTSASKEEPFLDFFVFGWSLLRCSSSSWLLPVSLLFRLLRSWASICWMLSKTSYWVLEVCSWASKHRRRSSLSAMFTDALSVRTELTVAEEAYPLSSSSSSDHWTDPLFGSGKAIAVEEDGCS